MAQDHDLGPHERWLYGPGKVWDLPGLWLDAAPCLSAVAEFAAPVGKPATALGSLLTHDGITMTPRLAPLWTGGGFRPHALPFFLQPESPLALEAHDPARLATLLGQLPPGARHIRLNFPLRSETVNAQTVPAQALAPSHPQGTPLVVLGVIDHGIAFAHKGLAGRMDYCWSQAALAAPGQPVPFGQEFRRAAGDEDEIYRAAGLLGGANRPPMPLARRVAHGTHVLGTAAAGPDTVRLVGVDLPATALWDTSGFGTDMFILAGLHYIFDRADKIAAAHGLTHVPVVVNISLGWSGGPHDGSSVLEAAIDEIVRYRRTLAPTLLVLPTGNMFNDQLAARIEEAHFQGGLAAIRWFAPPADRTSSFAEAWLPGPPEGWTISLASPCGEVTVLAAPGWQHVVLDGKIVGLMSLDQLRGGRWRATFCLAPTEPRASLPGHAAAPCGEWWITLQRPARAAGPVQLRIQRDEDHGQGHTGARQSRLRDPAYLPFDETGAPGQRDTGAMICRMDGLNGLATQGVSLNVAGSVDVLARAARYSSAGIGRGADVSAPSDRGIARPGVLSWATRSGGFALRSGTSSAAPRVAAELARALLTQQPQDNGASLLVGAEVPPADQPRLGSLRL